MANQTLVQALPLLLELATDLADGKLSSEEQARLVEHAGPLVQQLLLQQLMRVEHPPAPAVPVVVPLTPPPAIPASAPPPFPVPAAVDDWTVDEIRGTLEYFEGPRDAPDAPEPGVRGRFYPASETQLVGWRAKLNFTPRSRGRQVPDEVVRTWYMADGHSPQAQPRWTLDGKMQWNSQDEPDHFSLQGYDRLSSPNAGWTIVLLLERQAGPGKGAATATNSRPAQFNNGHEVSGPNPPVTWQTD